MEISSHNVIQTTTVKITDYIHPEAVFMLHGFGDSVPLRTRSFQKGVSDVKLQNGLLKMTVGGNCPLTECVVSVRKGQRREDIRESPVKFPRIPKWKGINYIQQIQKRCIGCRACELHCITANHPYTGPSLGIIVKREMKLVDNVPRLDFDFIHCFHCKKAPCMTDCPTNAIKRREKDSIVYIDQQLCNNCGVCINSCPWHVPKLHEEKQKVFKCDYCMHRLDAGFEPACVTGCTTKALVWVTSDKA